MAQVILPAELATQPNSIVADFLASAPLEVDISTCALAGEILYRRNEPARWVEICEMSLKTFNPPFERRIALDLEVANGLRRMPGRWDIGRAREILEEASVLIRILPQEHSMKGRLQELEFYHGALVEHAAGNFAEEALLHDFAHALSGANTLGRAIAGFMAANARINSELMDARMPNKVLLGRFADRDRELQRVLDMDTAEGRRWNVNRLCFRLRVAWLTGSGMLWGDLGKIWSSCQEFGSAFDGPLHVLQAAFQRGSVGSESVQDLIAFASRQGDLDWRSEALLVVAQYHQVRGELLLTIQTLRSILALETEGHGGCVARAIARTMLQGPEAK